VQASSIPRLLLGALAVLLAAGAYPALRATRQDPVDVLEPKGS
jgi:ABC-type antimicrobial peptide transport system permease subunit